MTNPNIEKLIIATRLNFITDQSGLNDGIAYCNVDWEDDPHSAHFLIYIILALYGLKVDEIQTELGVDTFDMAKILRLGKKIKSDKEEYERFKNKLHLVKNSYDSMRKNESELLVVNF